MSTAVVSTTVSSDGTKIAYERSGEGPALILVDGALCYRAFGPSKALAKELEQYFTVYRYDRRARGESGDTKPYAVEREVEDIDALVKEAGGSAYAFGLSSGAALALEAASRLGSITKLAMYEAPYLVDDSREPIPADLAQRFEQMVAAGKRGATVRLFMKTVGTPAIFVAIMPLMVPVWSKLKGVAHTLAYDIRTLGGHTSGKPLSADQWTSATQPTLVMDGGKSPASMRNAQRAVADVLSNAQYRTLAGQTHMVKAPVIAPVVTEFFTERN
jgi:pimeloyl-ACP methyl ester carboxylesterase